MFHVVIAILIVVGGIFVLQAILHLLRPEADGSTPSQTSDTLYRMADGQLLTLEQMREERDRYLDALRELDDDLEMNKISATDKAALEADYQRRTLAMIAEIERVEKLTPGNESHAAG